MRHLAISMLFKVLSQGTWICVSLWTARNLASIWFLQNKSRNDNHCTEILTYEFAFLWKVQYNKGYFKLSSDLLYPGVFFDALLYLMNC